MTAIVVTPVTMPRSPLFDDAPLSAEGHSFRYQLYRVRPVEQIPLPKRFCADDGALVVAIHCFATDEAASAWMHEDDKRWLAVAQKEQVIR